MKVRIVNRAIDEGARCGETITRTSAAKLSSDAYLGTLLQPQLHRNQVKR